MLYYHSYDFDGTCPDWPPCARPCSPGNSWAGAAIAPIAWRLTERFGSETCAHATG